MKKVKRLIKKRKSLYLKIFVLVLVVIAILGYSIDRKKEPIRVAFETKGGGVIFDHKLHVSLKDTNCEECHHNYEPDSKDPSEMNCRKCHYNSEFAEACEDEAVHKRCIGKNCVDCHVKDSAGCDFCHNAEVFKKILEPKTINFDTEGGLVVFDHFKHASPDEYDVDCESCHHGYKPENKKIFVMNCRRCHYNKKYEKICESADTHVRCIGKNCLECHSEGTEKCEICHKEE